METKKVLTANPDETRQLGHQVAQHLQGNENICLFGELGAGKTAFVQGLAQGLMIAETVKSPTFTYLREYDIPMRSTKFAHYDLYRLSDSPTFHDLDSIELFERLANDDVIVCIEWAEKLEAYQNNATFKVRFRYLEDEQREIEIPKRLLYPSPRR
jgi:tRNA threonylcarbamoyladenosine biosynthesis protein TsaE